MIAAVIDGASRWCVPVYLMLSGALLLTYRRRYSTEQFFRKRLLRVGIPFAAWSAIYIIWELATQQTKIETWRDLWALSAFPAEFHLWFFFLILTLYLLTPALSILIEHASRRLLWSMVWISFLGSALITQTQFTHLGTLFTSYIPLTVDTGYIGWFVLGYLLVSEVRRPPTWMRAAVYIATPLCIALMIWVTYEMNRPGVHATTEYLMDYTALTVVIETLAVFLVVRAVPWKRVFRWRWSRAVLNEVALATFGIYLVHLLVKYYVDLYGPWVPPAAFSLRYQLIAPLMIFAFSCAITIPMRRLPLVKWIIP